MVKLISLIVLTHFFQFNELKILRQNRQCFFFTVFLNISKIQYFQKVHVVLCCWLVCVTFPLETSDAIKKL